MTWWLLYDRKDVERNRAYIDRYFKACEKRGIELTFIVEDELTIEMDNSEVYFLRNGKKIRTPDAVINRTRNYYLAVQLEQLGLLVYNNSQVTLLGARKDLALAYVQRLGCEIMPTGTGSFVRSFPCVLKTVDGHGGTEVCLADDEEAYRKYIKSISGRTYISQSVASDTGRDLRIYVLGGRVIAAMLRVSKNDFRSNFCLGGSAEIYHLTKEEEQIVQKIIRSLKIDFCGIDFIFHQGRMIFNEIEDVVGSRMLYILTDIDVVEMYVDHIRQKSADHLQD